ncbi:alpha/beta hydrolase [Corallococcus sp. AB011P]|uniref:alpha/beta fold hydrolase n=1 Tax=Corallococcus sp. AB011P TaxID=2316735 RepID=UPI000EA3DF9F|nr:alpha/beta hydrolase [Corallococcus sp. AB011P]RKG60602.1 alpha/beta hydrolase [Corallococcus sp. AB011P]
MTTWMRGVCETNGINLHYLRTGGANPPVVLLHGLIGSGACWTPVARVLEGEFDVVMPDARGHGDSSTPNHGYRYDDHANDVVGLIRGLELSRPVVMGHSMGGMTAAVVASRGTDLRGLILVDPTFLSPERQREVHASDVAEQHRQALGLSRSELVAQAIVRQPHRSPELIELLAEARLKTHLEAFDVLTPPNPDYRDVVSATDVPILLVIGDRGPVVTFEMATELRSLNPRVRIEEIQDAGHGLPYDQPERLAEVVASFMRELA